MATPRANGILSIPVSATQRKPAAGTVNPLPKAAVPVNPTKPAPPRLKIIIRRLPPGLTPAEFELTLGDEWKPNGGKVDWLLFKKGKPSIEYSVCPMSIIRKGILTFVFNSPTKPSRPARAYLHLIKSEYIGLLSEHVHNLTFNDAKGTAKDIAPSGPPSVEFAPYGRVPNYRAKPDLRQGTIDQDPEFIEFLESLTNPITKATPVDQGSGLSGKNKEKITVTPLIQFLKDKKANKGKETVAAPKVSKHTRQDSKEKTNPTHDKKSSKPENPPGLSPDRRSAQAIKVEKAARDVVRVINKQAPSKTKSPAASPIHTVAALTPTHIINAPFAEKKRERGNVSAAAKILQRDLGLAPYSNGRGGRRGATGSAVEQAAIASSHTPLKQDSATVQPFKESVNSPLPTAATKHPAVPPSATPVVTKLPTHVQPPRGPAALRSPAKMASISEVKPARPNLSSNPPKNSSVSNSTQAFLKHANPSQGITEPLLEEAFAGFGAVKKVEIDKKKGFGYVDFAEPQSLQDAIKASPIKVAQGQVVVLERKAGPALQARNARGSPMMGGRGAPPPIGPRGGRGGGMRRGGLSRGGAHILNPNIPKTQKPADPPSVQNDITKSTTPGDGNTVQSSSEPVFGQATIPTLPAVVAGNKSSSISQ